MNPKAWIEKMSGDTVPIHGDFGLGRSNDNQLQVEGRGVSRRHALIHLQNGREYWLADLGSRNGTFLNDRRLSRPTRLSNGDRIEQIDCSDVALPYFPRLVADIADRAETAISQAHTFKVMEIALQAQAMAEARR